MKNIKPMQKALSLILIFAFITAFGCFVCACDSENDSSNASSDVTPTASTDGTESSFTYTDPYGKVAENIGDSSTAKAHFIFKVTDIQGNTYIYRIFTDKTNIGEALSDAKLIKGDKGQYGLFVTEVKGIKSDSDNAWMLYINGEQAMTGVDSVILAENTEYEFRLEALK